MENDYILKQQIEAERRRRLVATREKEKTASSQQLQEYLERRSRLNQQLKERKEREAQNKNAERLQENRKKYELSSQQIGDAHARAQAYTEQQAYEKYLKRQYAKQQAGQAEKRWKEAMKEASEEREERQEKIKAPGARRDKANAEEKERSNRLIQLYKYKQQQENFQRRKIEAEVANAQRQSGVARRHTHDKSLKQYENSYHHQEGSAVVQDEDEEVQEPNAMDAAKEEEQKTVERLKAAKEAALAREAKAQTRAKDVARKEAQKRADEDFMQDLEQANRADINRRKTELDRRLSLPASMTGASHMRMIEKQQRDLRRQRKAEDTFERVFLRAPEKTEDAEQPLELEFEEEEEQEKANQPLVPSSPATSHALSFTSPISTRPFTAPAATARGGSEGTFASPSASFSSPSKSPRSPKSPKRVAWSDEESLPGGQNSLKSSLRSRPNGNQVGNNLGNSDSHIHEQNEDAREAEELVDTLNMSALSTLSLNSSFSSLTPSSPTFHRTSPSRRDSEKIRFDMVPERRPIEEEEPIPASPYHEIHSTKLDESIESSMTSPLRKKDYRSDFPVAYRPPQRTSVLRDFSSSEPQSFSSSTELSPSVPLRNKRELERATDDDWRQTDSTLQAELNKQKQRQERLQRELTELRERTQRLSVNSVDVEDDDSVEGFLLSTEDDFFFDEPLQHTERIESTKMKAASNYTRSPQRERRVEPRRPLRPEHEDELLWEGEHEEVAEFQGTPEIDRQLQALEEKIARQQEELRRYSSGADTADLFLGEKAQGESEDNESDHHNWSFNFPDSNVHGDDRKLTETLSSGGRLGIPTLRDSLFEKRPDLAERLRQRMLELEQRSQDKQYRHSPSKEYSSSSLLSPSSPSSSSKGKSKPSPLR